MHAIAPSLSAPNRRFGNKYLISGSNIASLSQRKSKEIKISPMHNHPPPCLPSILPRPVPRLCPACAGEATPARPAARMRR